MIFEINNEFKSICKKIIEENKSAKEWTSIESDDMFQTNSFCGGFDAIEMAFCFSYYDEVKKEHWFQLSLEEIKKIKEGIKTQIEMRVPD